MADRTGCQGESNLKTVGKLGKIDGNGPTASGNNGFVGEVFSVSRISGRVTDLVTMATKFTNKNVAGPGAGAYLSGWWTY